MRFLALSTILLVSVALSQCAYPNQIDKAKLKFRLAGRQLADKDDGFGTSDPYVELFVTEGASTSEKSIGTSDKISNNENPDWGKEFQIDYDRSKNQWIHFLVWDEDDLRTDDKVGAGWMSLNDFVDRGQVMDVPLYKKGYLTIKSTESGTKPTAPAVGADTQKVSFRLSAKNLPDKDDLGTIDPYVEIFSVDGITGSENKVGKTATQNDNKNPTWSEAFDINFNRGKQQRLVLKVWDHDNLREDDKGGVGYIWMEDLVRNGGSYTIPLSKRGFLTLTKA